ncbi:MAG: CehA/McbA family metallohydrolase [Planctomycetota bacterium]|nr:CehA/McbA family metallohydrolase [Planctomycetota bacterium]
MSGYRPLDLAKLCNATAKLGRDGKVPSGKRTWHGLPFKVGGGRGGRCVVAFGAKLNAKPLSIPINRTAYSVIVAHRLLDSKLREGDNVGRACAEYVFRYAGGEELVVPIRERMEIAIVPSGWGQLPFLAWPDSIEGLPPRYEGHWGAAGHRQTEANGAYPRDFYLWPWRNPHPERKLAELLVRPLGPRFYVGAVTLGLLDEEPFRTQAKREVKIVLPKKADADQRFALEVEVDRGVATFPYALPRDPVKGFLKDDFKGWGEEKNEKASPAYVEIAATPSATVTVKQGGKKLGAANWGEVQRKKKVKPNKRLELILVDEGRNWVRTTVLDDETGKPVPCRIHFRSRDGVPFAPHGHHPHVNSDMGTWHIDIGGDLRLGQISYAYIDGRCEGWLPRGEIVVDVARGYEYEPLREKLEIKPGQRELTLRLKRFANMAKERYFSGDTHVHFLSTQGAHCEAAGEGLNVVNLLLSQWGHLFTNTEEFTGRPSVDHGGETIVYATQENRQHMLGHLTLLGLKEPVMPWCSDGPGEAELGGNLETTLSRWADACHAQGGTVVIPHIPNPNGEPAALIATGRADAAEWLIHDSYMHQEYYRYLNCGYKLPIVGGTDKMTADVPVGIYRTYVHIPEGEPFTYDSWCKYMKAGNTFHSGGPLLRFSANGQPIGSTVNLPGNGGAVEVEASARGVLPFNSLELVMNGQVVARTESKQPVRALSLKEKLTVEKHAWLAARCSGPKYWESRKHQDGWRRGLMAHTSPIYLAVGGPWWMFDLGTANYMLTLLHGGIDYIHKRSPQHEKGSVTHHHHHEDHLKFLEEPYRQAIQAIHKRMHDLGIPH